ncbi:MAG: hypothetical protein JWP44_1172 [Mucilaginibacter sp.]|nr:hypothetical protein [Mucilaginibacter sp.]
MIPLFKITAFNVNNLWAGEDGRIAERLIVIDPEKIIIEICSQFMAIFILLMPVIQIGAPATLLWLNRCVYTLVLARSSLIVQNIISFFHCAILLLIQPDLSGNQ